MLLVRLKRYILIPFDFFNSEGKLQVSLLLELERTFEDIIAANRQAQLSFFAFFQLSVCLCA